MRLQLVEVTQPSACDLSDHTRLRQTKVRRTWARQFPSHLRPTAPVAREALWQFLSRRPVDHFSAPPSASALLPHSPLIDANQILLPTKAVVVSCELALSAWPTFHSPDSLHACHLKASVSRRQSYIFRRRA